MIDERRFEELNAAVMQLLRRQYDLEQRLARLEGVPQPPQEEVPVAASPMVSASTSPVITVEESRPGPLLPQPKAVPEVAQSLRPALETKVGLTVVNRIGVITLILGVAFFFKWAVDNEWIGPTGRVLLGLLAGFAALGLAEYLRRKSQEVFAQGITGAGLALLYLSVYAAFGFYHLIPQSIAFAFMASTTALGYALSQRQNSLAIAALGFFGGYATPFLLSSGGDHPWFLFSYVFLLDAAAMRLVKEKGWRLLEALALVVTAGIYFVWLDNSLTHRRTLIATLSPLAYYGLFFYFGTEYFLIVSHFLTAVALTQAWSNTPGAFFALEVPLALAGLVYWIKHNSANALRASFLSFWLATALFLVAATSPAIGTKFIGLSLGFLLFLFFSVAGKHPLLSGRIASVQSLSILAANGSVYFGFAYLLLRGRYQEWLGLLAVAVACTYVALAALLRREGSLRDAVNSKPMLVSLGMAMAFVTLAIPIQLTGFHITIGWAIQAAALTWIASKLHSDRALMAGSGLLLLVAFRLVLFESALWPVSLVTTLLVNARFFTFLVSAVCAFLAARWAVSLDRRFALGHYILANLILLSGLSLEALLWARKTSPAASLLSVETVSLSILFAVYALTLVSIGVATRTAVHRITGLIIVAFVMVKLYLFDVWQLDRVYRIAAFVVLGLLLISTSFLYSRFRPMIDSLLRNDETPSS